MYQIAAEMDPKTPDTFKVHASRLEELEALFAKFNRRYVKLGLPVATFTIVDTFVVERKNPSSARAYIEPVIRDTFHKVVVTVPAPLKVEGWSLIGSVDFSHSTPIVTTAPGVAGDVKFRSTNNSCDHCNTDRRRAKVILFQHDDGHQIQIGTNCAREYFGRDIKSELAYWRGLDNLGNEFEGFGSARGSVTYDIRSSLVAVAYAVRTYGFMSRGAAMALEAKSAEFTTVPSTSDIVGQWLWNHPENHRDWIKPLPLTSDITVEDEALADAAIAWAAELTDSEVEDARGDYLHNVRVLARDGFFLTREWGLACSIVGVYKRNIDKAAEESRSELDPFTASKTSEHLGAVKERREFTARLYSVIGTEGHYGTTYIHKFATETGDVLVWFSSAANWADEQFAAKDKVVTFTATVKKHDEFRGLKQTVVTRAKFGEVIEQPTTEGA